ncbi:unnamed protein product [marine sediment metagenome]|uniref:Uncharacterized protein n=1 Tax=marine sediment metagenome TaxID=412755 RepID=X1SU18_9ZZZZ
MGYLKVENESYSLRLDGAKNYRTEYGRKIKGIPKKAIEVRPGVFQYTSFWSQTLHLRSKQIIGARVTQKVRILKHTYDKGKVLKSGRVIPFRF